MARLKLIHLHCLNCPVRQKPEKRHESRLKKFWRSPKATSSDDSTGAESPTHLKGQKLQQLQLSPVYNKPACSLPLLQVWPSQVRKKHIYFFKIFRIEFRIFSHFYVIRIRRVVKPTVKVLYLEVLSMSIM